MQSQTKYVWCENVGCALITIQNQQTQIRAELQSKVSSMYEFYTTNFYQDIQFQFKQIGINFLSISEIENGPSTDVLLPKIYCDFEPFNDALCYVQFPIFLSDSHINSLQKLNLYMLLSNYSIWIQYYYYLDNNNGYKISNNIYFNHWYNILNIGEFVLQIRNSGSDVNVMRRKIETVAITELKKNQSYEYNIKQMNNYFDGVLIIAFDINKLNNKFAHFKTIRNEINRHILNNINAKNNKYRCNIINENKIKFIDFETSMNNDNRWNISDNWINKNSHKNSNNSFKNNNNYSTNYNTKYTYETYDIFDVSLNKVRKPSKSYTDNKSYNAYDKSTDYSQYNNNSYSYRNNNAYYKPQQQQQNNAYQPPQQQQQQLYEYSDESDDATEPIQYPHAHAQNNNNNSNINNEEHKSNSSNTNYNSSPTSYNPSPNYNNNISPKISPKSYNNNASPPPPHISMDKVDSNSFQPGAASVGGGSGSVYSNHSHNIPNNNSNIGGNGSVYSNHSNHSNIGNKSNNSNTNYNPSPIYNNINNNNNQDYRGYLLPSTVDNDKFALIIDIDYNKSEKHYKIIDCNGNMEWIAKNCKFYQSVNMYNNNSMPMNDNIEFIQKLTAKQIYFWVDIVKRRTKEET